MNRTIERDDRFVLHVIAGSIGVLGRITISVIRWIVSC